MCHTDDNNGHNDDNNDHNDDNNDHNDDYTAHRNDDDVPPRRRALISAGLQAFAGALDP